MRAESGAALAIPGRAAFSTLRRATGWYACLLTWTGRIRGGLDVCRCNAAARDSAVSSEAQHGPWRHHAQFSRQRLRASRADAAASLAARAGEEPRPPPYNLILEGSLPEATVLNVAVDAKGVKPIVLTLVGGKVLNGVSIPAEGAPRRFACAERRRQGDLRRRRSTSISARISRRRFPSSSSPRSMARGASSRSRVIASRSSSRPSSVKANYSRASRPMCSMRTDGASK